MPAAAVVIFASFKATYVPEYVNALTEPEKTELSSRVRILPRTYYRAIRHRDKSCM